MDDCLLFLFQNVFITGGGATIPGIKERIEAEVLAMRPFESKFNVKLAGMCAETCEALSHIWNTFTVLLKIVKILCSFCKYFFNCSLV